jgi:hypothetical protein
MSNKDWCYTIFCVLFFGSCMYSTQHRESEPVLTEQQVNVCAKVCGTAGVEEVKPDSCACNLPLPGNASYTH